jgi:hypothetical protein
VAHAAVFLALFWRFGSTPSLQSVPVMNVALVRLHSAERPRPKLPSPARQAISRTRAAVTPDNPPDVPPRPFAPPLPDLAPGPDANAGMRTVLRGLVGCEHATLARLSPAERQDCLDRLARRRTAELGKAPALNLDRRGDYAVQDPTPYLIRRPKDGCKPRAAGYVRPVPSGAASGFAKPGVAAGVDCAWSF